MSMHLCCCIIGFHQGHRTIWWCTEEASKPLTDSKVLEEWVDKPHQCSEPRGPRVGGRRSFLTTTPFTNYPWSRDYRANSSTPIWRVMGLHLKDLSGHPICPGSLPIWSKPVSSEAGSHRWSKSTRPGFSLLLGPYFILHFRLTELEDLQPLI